MNQAQASVLPLESSSLLTHLQELVSRPSITPRDAGCQEYLMRELGSLGFNCRQISRNGIDNLIAVIGKGSTRIAFAGHTDVVPPGNASDWRVDPFQGNIVDGRITGRGVGDMKGGIAAMLSAVAKQLAKLDLQRFSFYFLITSDEEGEAEFGTREIVKYLKQKGELPHFCIVGEPSASRQTGDVIRVGRRGAISGEIRLSGKQGHVAYPSHASNAAHKAAEVANWLANLSWEQGSSDFPGTSLQVTAIDTGTWTDNIIPGNSKVCFNVRYSHLQTEFGIRARILAGLKSLDTTLSVDWQRPCQPYFTDTHLFNGVSLVTEVEQAIFKVCRRFPGYPLREALPMGALSRNLAARWSNWACPTPAFIRQMKALILKTCIPWS